MIRNTPSGSARCAVALLCALLELVFVDAYAADDAPVTAYENGKWWDGETFKQGTRYIKAGTFVAASVAAPNRTISLLSAFIVPPLADAHNHMVGAPPSVNAAAEAAGVFYLINPNVLASEAPPIGAALSGSMDIDAVLAMGGITAPGGHPEKLYVDTLGKYVYPDKKPGDFVGDAFHYVTGKEEIDPVLDRLIAQGAQFVKIYLLFSEEFEQRKDDPAYRGYKGLNPKMVPAIVAAAHKRHLRVAAHIETAADFRAAVAAGVDECAHMPGYFVQNEPLSKYEITNRDAKSAARAHVVVVATASYALYGDKDRLALVQAMQRKNLHKLRAAGVPILIGTDGKPDAALAEAHYLIDLGVFTERQALNSLAVDTPRFILPARKIGALRVGYEASFLVLNADPSVDFDALTHIKLRVKQGESISPRMPPRK